MQIILGTGVVNKVYDEFIQIAGVSESSKEDLKKVAASRANPVQRLIKTLGDIFVPIIPAIVASGFLMGIMEALNFMVNNGFLNIDTSGSIYTFAQLFSNTAYTFLPILIAYSGAKVFGANPYLGAVIGMIMIHPNLQNAWTVATEGVQATQKVWFGLYSIDMVGYQGHVIPVIIAVWVLAQIEKRLHKVVPAMFDLFVTPLVSVFITGYLTFPSIPSNMLHRKKANHPPNNASSFFPIASNTNPTIVGTNEIYDTALGEILVYKNGMVST